LPAKWLAWWLQEAGNSVIVRNPFVILVVALFALFVSTCVSASETAQAPQRVAPLPELIARLPTVARNEAGIGSAEQELTKAIQSYRAEAIPSLIPLLESPNPGVRRLAGYILRDIDGLTEKELDALIAARLRGDGWIPPAIGRIGTPRAIRFLIEELRKVPDRDENAQVSWALEKASGDASLLMAETFAESKPTSRAFALAIGEILREKGAGALPAIDPLVATALDKSKLLGNRKGAVLALGAIGPDAGRTVPELRRLATADPENFRSTVETAIVAMGVPESVPWHVSRLREKPDIVGLRDLAAIRENGRAAGPALVELMASPDWEIRVGAVRAIGFVDYAEGTDALIKALHDPDDWRLAYASAESLGRIRASAAIPQLVNRRAILTHFRG
jgi:HEAT repeat protein